MEHQRWQCRGHSAAEIKMIERKFFCNWSPRDFKRRVKQSFRGEGAQTLGTEASEDTNFASFSNIPQSEIPECDSPAETSVETRQFHCWGKELTDAWDSCREKYESVCWHVPVNKLWRGAASITLCDWRWLCAPSLSVMSESLRPLGL